MVEAPTFAPTAGQYYFNPTADVEICLSEIKWSGDNQHKIPEEAVVVRKLMCSYLLL